MKLVIGLGNPGDKYKRNRHNAGHMLVDQLDGIDGFKFFKTDTFMNSSGKFVKEKLDYFNIDIENLYIALDDLDLKLGEYKITKKSPKDHKGIHSIDEYLKTDDYVKIRIGVDNRDSQKRVPGEKYVLQDFSELEIKKLEDVFAMISKELK